MKLIYCPNLTSTSWIPTINTVLRISHQYLVLMLPTQSIYLIRFLDISNTYSNLNNISTISHQYFTRTIKFDFTKISLCSVEINISSYFVLTHLCTILVLVFCSKKGPQFYYKRLNNRFSITGGNHNKVTKSLRHFKL